MTECSISKCSNKVYCKGICNIHYQRQRGYESQKKYQKEQNALLRKIVLTHYSEGKLECVCCGEKIYEFLTLDHINNDGHQHKMKVSTNSLSFYKDIIRHGFPPWYQLLCHNCNWARGILGKCPHEKETKQ